MDIVRIAMPKIIAILTNPMRIPKIISILTIPMEIVRIAMILGILMEIVSITMILVIVKITTILGFFFPYFGPTLPII